MIKYLPLKEITASYEPEITDALTRIQDRIDEIYAEITTDPIFKELDEAQAAVNELMQNVNNTIMYHATGSTPCSHDCSSCSGCH